MTPFIYLLISFVIFFIGCLLMVIKDCVDEELVLLLVVVALFWPFTVPAVTIFFYSLYLTEVLERCASLFKKKRTDHD